MYFTQEQFLTCEDSFHETLDYIAEVLDGYESNLLHRYRWVQSFVPVIVTSTEDQLANFWR